MQRQPEPELMEDMEQAIAYAQADFSAPHQSFIEILKQKFYRLRGTVVDLGCGPADISIRCARNFPGTRIVAIDGARAMLDLAQQAVDAQGFSGLIQLKHCVLPASLDIKAKAIISNSLLHHLHDPQVMWQSVKSVAADHCKVFIMDLLRPDTEEQAQALVDRYAANEAEILRRDFYHSLLAAFRPGEIEQQLKIAHLPLQIEVISDRHMIIYGELQSTS